MQSSILPLGKCDLGILKAMGSSKGCPSPLLGIGPCSQLRGLCGQAGQGLAPDLQVGKAEV